MEKTIPIKKAAIIGAHGFAGRELARILLQHPSVELYAVFSRNSHWSLGEDLPEDQADSVSCYGIETLKEHCSELDFLFLATPADVSMDIVRDVYDKVPHIIDLSGAYRLTPNDYQIWYHNIHQDPDGLKSAQFGLVPWNQEIDRQTRLVSNPGCFATCALMALLPLLKDHIISPQDIIIDAKSGVSGAGRATKSSLLFNELDGDFYPYRIGEHQHTPEIITYLAKYAQQQTTPMLLTQLLPIKRGISMSIYTDLLSDSSNDILDDLVYNAYDDAYKDYELARYVSLQQAKPTFAQKFLSLKRVVGSSRVHIAYKVLDKKLLVIATIDNLMKGAASQAIENMNVILQLPLSTALTCYEGTL